MPPPASAPATMGTLASLVEGHLRGGADVMVVDATVDSRRVGPGWLFIAVPGASLDGHDFVAAAAGNGAAGLCVSRDVESPLPIIAVPSTRAVMAKLAASIHRFPSQVTSVVGVTGTNGKTTVTFLLESIARHAGRPCGLVGTVVTRLGDIYLENPHTTPEATDLQRLFRRMVDGGAEIIACEVSSHALALGRVEETTFAVGAFTNLSQDHLDFHGGMEEYFAAKAALLRMAERKVIWVEDPYGSRLAEEHPDALRVGWQHDVSAREITADRSGTTFELVVPGGTASTRLQLPGPFNLANALIAAGCAHLLGFEAGQIAEGLGALSSVSGRFEVIADDPVTVVVDYAHTPEGIETVIETARTLSAGRVIVVFGAGGDRDRGKRPRMGKAASTADLLIVTTDNPRSEDPLTIATEVLAGADHPAAMSIIDRREAIATALDSARPGDIVLILGKGHESTQEVEGIFHPFSDQKVAQAWLAARSGGREAWE
ncbi:MAG TPA: UDP-N-acetylmuramoyl-L-alanyl-D-glutamate--2,6-diaminopimelate ligase [Acidimicrobiia bacterium]|nr:UDP-N-acetylmuramoyl-L-alanyl-D-glutamate--2,6-diaminopimelate ligase [Acidimicrobiia bacterium]